METARPRHLTILAVTGTVVVVAAMASLWLRGRSLEVQYALFVFHNGPPALLLFWLGRLVLLRQPGNRVGWVLEGVAVLGAVHVAVAAWADRAMVDWGYSGAITSDHGLVPAEMPLSATVPLFFMNWLWVPQPVLLIGVLPLIFPDGRLPARTWRIGLWLTGAAGAFLIAATAIDGWPTSSWSVADGPPAVVEVLFALGGLLLLAAAAIAIAGLVSHWRQAPPDRRQPFHIVGTAIALMALIAVATYPWQWLWIPTVLAALYLVLAAYALAAARFRVHDLEPVLARSTIAAVLSLAASAAYVAAVLGVGLLATRATDDDYVPLVAVGVAAVSAEPVRRGVRRLIDRLVFRLAADREQVVSTLAAELGAEAHDGDEFLTAVVESVRLGSAADRVEAWLATEGGLALARATGTARSHSTVILTQPIRHAGEDLGELRVLAGVAGDLAPKTPALLADVAQVTGAALRNQQLGAALKARLAELDASRRRLVDAQDGVRRGIERDLHDGAQAELISLRLRLAVLQARISGPDDTPPDVAEELADIAAGIDAAVGNLRDLARGIHPPILDQDGVATALRAHARTLPIPVTFTTDGFGRQQPAVESAVYFACLEAIQNAVKHSGATHIEITLAAAENAVTFTVADDGSGFDPGGQHQGSGLVNIEDRCRALGGHVRIESALGSGTVVVGRCPR